MRQRILVATDFSPASAPAFRQAVALCRERGTSLLIAHALEPPFPLTTEGFVLPQMYSDIAAALRAEAEKKLRKLLAAARRANVPARGLLLRGSPQEAITRAARSQKAGLIVVGTHGRSGWSRLVLGSVASKVIATSRLPVLVVPARRERSGR